MRLRLFLGSVDKAELGAWIDPTLSPDARFVRWKEPCPDEFLAAYAAAHEPMNDQPLGDLAGAEAHLTPDSIRAAEAHRRLVGEDRWYVCAQDMSTGAIVGTTDIWFLPDQPTLIIQGSTAVAPSHRGMRLEMRMKSPWFQMDTATLLAQVDALS